MVDKHVRMAEAKTVEGSEKIISEGIGSCVVVCLRDSEKELGGLAHVVLPSKQKSNESCKYADNVLEELLEKIEQKGGDLEALEAKIFGGAHLFDFSSQIGDKNIEAVQEFLKEHGIPIMAEDTGGEKGRSIKFDPVTGKVEVKKSFEDEEVY